jgi:hypothetical protein
MYNTGTGEYALKIGFNNTPIKRYQVNADTSAEVHNYVKSLVDGFPKQPYDLPHFLVFDIDPGATQEARENTQYYELSQCSKIPYFTGFLDVFGITETDACLDGSVPSAFRGW